jgi:hypothetical protein
MTETDKDNSLDIGDIQPVNGVYMSMVTIDGGYTYSDSHQYFTAITNVQGTPTRITNPALAGRVFSGDTVVFTDVTGTLIGAVVMTRQNAGTNDTWRLVAYEDTGIVGLPMLLNGGNIIVTWNAAGIFGL